MRCAGRKLLFFCLLAGSLALGACKGTPDAGGPPQGGPSEVGIVVIKAAPASLKMELPGRVVPRLLAEVRPQVNGIIRERLFIEGSDVGAGQVLYRIDPASYRAVAAGAAAALARAEATLVPARLKAERFRDLLVGNAVSQQEYDEALAAYRQAEAELLAARAAGETARINLDYTEVKAPIAGRIGRSAVTEGALVNANQTAPLALIQQLNPVFVDLSQSSADLLRLKRNLAAGGINGKGPTQAPVALLLEDGSSYPHTGSLKFGELSVDQATGSVSLRAVFPNPQLLLLPGMFVRALVQEKMSEQAILVPQRGVTRNPKGEAMVMLANADGKVEARPITVLRTVGDNWLVGKGLAAGDRVILEGIQRARPGSPVKVMPFVSPTQAPAAKP